MFCSLKKNDEIKLKHDNEIKTLRKEHKALEEVIQSLRVQCDTLKTSLQAEYESKENLRKQISDQSIKTNTNGGVSKNLYRKPNSVRLGT